MTPGIVGESDLSGTPTAEYVFFDGERVARKDSPGNAVSYYFSDHLKTASVITDSAGNIKAESDYYPWGGELQFVNNDSNDYKFTAKKRDTETGLDYFGARYYSNALGRWMSADWSATPVPVPYANFGDPQSLNQYSYVRNIPTSNVDLDGHGCPPLCDVQTPTAADWALIEAAGTAIGVAGPASALAAPSVGGTAIAVLGPRYEVPEGCGGDCSSFYIPANGERVFKEMAHSWESALLRDFGRIAPMFAAGSCDLSVVRIHESQLPATFRTYWYYDPVVGFLLVVLFVLFQRPRLLGLSRWRPKWIDIAIGIVIGIVVPLILWLSVQDPIRSLGFRPMLGTSLIPVIGLSPVLEELLFRATFLRSFESYFPKVVAILLSAMLVSLIHPHFLVVLPLELMASLLYVVLGHSLPTSITAHIANNAAVLFLSTGALEKWHTYVWSL